NNVDNKNLMLIDTKAELLTVTSLKQVEVKRIKTEIEEINVYESETEDAKKVKVTNKAF
ncbi:6112_t:CDS:1, partial [Cetraspora pellucida]